jgi:hypothetical protein
MLHVVLWKWLQPGFRETYKPEHVNVLAAQVKRHLNGEKHRIVCVTDDPGDIRLDVDTYPLWDDHNKVENISGRHLPSCYRRLRLFDPQTQLDMGVRPADRIMSMDLDTVIAGALVPLVQRKERFIGWAVRGTRHVRVFNGSMFLFTQGDFADVWTDFNPSTSPKAAFQAGFFGSDQGWLSYKLATRTDCAGWSYPQVVSYPREVARRPKLPNGCSVVNFHGKHKPWHEDVQRVSPWVKEHWRLPDAVQV